MSTPKNKKVFNNAQDALFDLFDGMSLMSGGFGLCGNAENCITEINRQGIKGITLISNNAGNQGQGLAVLLKKHQIAKVICSYVGGNPDLEAQMLSGEVQVELNPQGTLSERIRAGGSGIGGFFTPTGVGTVIAQGKEVREIDGKKYVLELPLKADFAIIRAEYGDPYGNLRFKGTARNFSPYMAMAAKTTIVEVDHMVALGDLSPDDIHLPGIFVQRIFQGQHYINPIEYRTTRPRPEAE